MVDNLEKRLLETQTELDRTKSQVAQLKSFLTSMTDVHESQTQSQKQLVQRLELLHRLDGAILSADSLENLAQMALTHVIQLIPCFRASIAMSDLTAKTLYILAFHSEVDTPVTAGKTYPLDNIYLSVIANDPYVTINDLNHSKIPIVQQYYEQGIRSILLVALRVEDNLVGLLILHSVHPDYFTGDKIQIAVEVAHQIAIGIDKKIRSDELARYVQRMEILHAIDLGIIQGKSVKAIVSNTLKQIQQLIPCERIGVGVIDNSTQEISIYTSNFDHASELGEGTRLPLPPDLLKELTAHHVRLVNDMHGTDDPVLKRLLEEGFQSHFQILLGTEGVNIGMIGFSSKTLNFFTPQHQEIAIEVAAQLSIVLHQMQLAEALEGYAHRMEILHAIDLGIIQGGSIKALVASTLKQIQQLIPCERIGVGIIEQATQEVIIYTSNFDYPSELVEGTRFPLPPDLLKELTVNHVRLVNDMHGTDGPALKRLLQEGFQSHFQILLGIEGVNIGMIGFSSKTLNFFTPQHQEIAIEVAAQLSIALHQMQLSEALERYTAELEQRVAERTSELQISKDQIEAILHNSLDGILLVDRDLKIRQANPAVSRLLLKELNNKEVVNLLDLVHPDYANGIRTSIEQAFLDELPVPIEVHTDHQDGRKRDVELSFGHIPGDGFVSTLHDITAHKQAEVALNQALDMQRELVAAKSQFVSVATHEFRTPLASILAATDTLLTYRDRLNAAQIDQKLERMRQCVWNMTALMEDTLQLSRIQSGRMDYRPVNADLDALCHSVIEEFEESGAGQNRFVYTSTASPVMLTFDQRLMKQAMINLFSNALKYSPADKPVNIALSQASSQIIFSVSDQGIGIPDEDLEHLFEPFHRASNTGSISGTGLGLSITKQIVDYHHGAIKVDSQVGQGTTFTVIIPAA